MEREEEASVERVLFDEATISQRVGELAAQISTDYRGRDPVLVCVLTGAYPFMADLCRKLTCAHQVDMIRVSSYKGTVAGELEMNCEPKIPLDGRHVVVVEDIVDTGRSLSFLSAYLEKRAASVELCALLDKVSQRQVAVPVKYVGFECPDAFVVGYGLDYNERFRSLPFVRDLTLPPTARPMKTKAITYRTAIAVR